MQGPVSRILFRHHRLETGEEVVDQWVAGVPFGFSERISKLGGNLVLTDRRLLFEPLKVTRKFEAWTGDQRASFPWQKLPASRLPPVARRG